MSLHATSASKVRFGYCTEDMQEVVVDFVVNSDYLWSADGLADLFDTCRLAYLGDLSEEPTEAWESWHLVSARDRTDWFVLVEREDPS